MSANDEAEDFAPGKVVRLRSGGPPMTVTSAATLKEDIRKVGTVHVKWFTADGHLQTGAFEARALRPVRYKAKAKKD